MRILLSALLLLLGAGAAAQPTAECPPGPPNIASRADELRQNARDRGLLWRLDKDGRTSWLYGTMHVNRIDWMVPGRQVVEAVRGSDVLALELDPADPELPRAFAAPGDPARSQRVLDGLQPLLAKAAARACLPEQALAPLRPMLQLTTLGMFEGRRDGFHPEMGVDAVLFGMARGLGKPVVGLETPASQLALLTPESEADERQLLEEGLREMDSGEARAVIRRMTELWARGDAEALANYPQWCQCLETPAERRLYARINDGRNPALADKLAALHGGGQRFFAGIGALHMTGPQALTDLLQARGFRVERIHFPAAP
jgi:uncharacterized protein